MFRLSVAALAALAVVVGAAHAADPAKVVQPFNGKDLEGWKFKGSAAKSKLVVGYASLDPSNPSKLVVVEKGDGPPQLVNSAAGVDFYTGEKFGDCMIEVEFMVPKGSNSGVYVHGEYEVQILDSFGKDKIGPGDLGGLYGNAAPKVNAAKEPGAWQKFVIDFQAPRFEDGKKVANAVFRKVVLNGQLIHENVTMKGPTPSGVTGKEAPTGPLMFQGDHGPVAFRNIKITPRAAAR
jgi:hypothetical protein